MPRGFLVKRQKQSGVPSWQRRNSEDDRTSDCGSNSGSELEAVSGPPPLTLIPPVGGGFPIPISASGPSTVYPQYGSPDSGYCQSPVNLTFKDKGFTGNQDQQTAASPRSERPSSSDNEGVSDRKEPEPQPCLSQNRGGFLSPRIRPASSPLSITTSAYGSPFYMAAFNRMNMCSPKSPFLMAPHPALFPGSPHAAYLPTLVGPGPKSPASSSPEGNHSGTPSKKRSREQASESSGTPAKAKTPKKPKAARRIAFDEDKSSPVSGTIIRDASDQEIGIKVVSGDIDSTINMVEVTLEAREELSKIENKIGDYICQLCKEQYEDAFQLAQHKCSRIVHVEYRCPECDKVFNCPANLASHRRWHKPRDVGEKAKSQTVVAASMNPSTALEVLNANTILNSDSGSNGCVRSPNSNTILADRLEDRGTDLVIHKRPRPDVLTVPGLSPPASQQIDKEGRQFACDTCGKRFRRKAYLRKHQATHAQSEEGRSYQYLVRDVCDKVFKNEPARAKNEIQSHGNNENAPGNNAFPYYPLPQHQMAPLSLSPQKQTTAGSERLSAPPSPTSPVADLRVDCTCPSCGQVFPGRQSLEHHQRTLHASEVYGCKYCASVFPSSPGLTRHINKCHPTESRQVILLQLPTINSRPC